MNIYKVFIIDDQTDGGTRSWLVKAINQGAAKLSIELAGELKDHESINDLYVMELFKESNVEVI